ncbi:MAG: tetratricopeptide repeat protein [Candidatus Gastranaerophilales bacterium]|nr:tetratricopeptide repeat protein [Candidatus Gastranaerophilales bacterium]
MVRALLTIIFFICITSSFSFAEEAISVADGIQSYKNGKFEECITTMKQVVKDDPTSAIGYYYLGLAYSKTGRKILAIQNYNKVISLGSDNTLIELAKNGKNQVGGKNITAIETQLEDIEEEIKSTSDLPKIEKLSPAELKAKYEEKITKPASSNNASSTVIKASDYQKANAQPTNDEIVNAIRILQKAGLLQNGVSGLAGGNPAGFNPEMDSKTQQMNAMLMMMGQNNNNNNSMMNMMPFMNSGNGKINPQMIQMMMMNQMMPNFTTGGSNGSGY